MMLEVERTSFSYKDMIMNTNEIRTEVATDEV